MQLLNTIKSFFLLTIRSIVGLYKNLVVIAWPMLIMTFVSILSMGLICYFVVGLQGIMVPLLSVFSLFWFQASVVLVRPSVEKKSMRAIVQKRTFGAFTIPAFMVALGVLLFHFLSKQPPFTDLFVSPLSVKALLMLPMHPMHIFSLIVLYILFFLDTDESSQNIVPSIVRAAKMIIYNFPIYFIVFVSLYCLFATVFVLIPNVYVATSLFVFLWPIPISVLSNLYIVWTHKQYSRYLG